MSSKPPPPPYIFIRVSVKVPKEAFRIYVGIGFDDKPIFGVIEGGLKRDEDDIVLDPAKLPGNVSQPLSLRLPPGFGVKGKQSRTASTISIKATLQRIRKFVQELTDKLPKVSRECRPGRSRFALDDEEECNPCRTAENLARSPRIKTIKNRRVIRGTPATAR